MSFRLFLLTVSSMLANAGDLAILQKERAFDKTEVTIKTGDTITFKNADEVVHNVFSATDGMEFDIRRQSPGGASTIPFPKAGKAEVRCSIHPKMKLVVIAKD